MRFVSLPLLLLSAVARASPACPSVQFEPWLTFDDHDLVWDVQTVDLNHDGRPDFVVTESNYDFVSAFINTGNGFTELHHLPTGNQPYPVSVADVDGDGQLDLCTGGGSRELSILFARDGGFDAPLSFGDAGENAITGLVVADFDGDGHLDSSAGSNFASSVTLLHGERPTSLVPWLVFDAGTPMGPAARADLNGDGLDDAAFTSYFYGITLVLSRRGGTPEFRQYRSAIPSNHDAVVIADLNGDGRLDIAQAANQGIAGYFQEADGGFTPRAVVTGQSRELAGLASGDFDGDGRVDLVAADSQTQVTVFLNEVGGFVVGGQRGDLAAPLRIAAADFDGDGRVDLVFSAYATSKILVYRNVTACAQRPDGGDGGTGLRWYPVGCSCSHDEGLAVGLALLLVAATRRARYFYR
jgi:MYXO-CTERM domain-containing protein